MEYDQLPPAIQGLYSRKEWAWLPDDQKNAVLDQECEPDYEEELSDAG